MRIHFFSLPVVCATLRQPATFSQPFRLKDERSSDNENQKSIRLLSLVLSISGILVSGNAQQPNLQPPSDPLKFGAFVARFDPGGTFTLEGKGWPALNGNWKTEGTQIELTMSGGPGGCDGPGRYGLRLEGKKLSFDLVSDTCRVRQIILDHSTWLPGSEIVTPPARRITATSGARLSLRPDPAGEKGSWPSFRGPQASGVAERQDLPDAWNAKTGENILWRTPIPGLAHSSPAFGEKDICGDSG